MELFKTLFKHDSEFIKIEAEYRRRLGQKNRLPIAVGGLSDGALESFICALLSAGESGLPKRALVLAGDEKTARKLSLSLASFFDGVVFFRKKDFAFIGGPAVNHFEPERLAALSKIAEKNFDVAVATPDAALQYTIPPEVLKGATFTLNSGADLLGCAGVKSLAEFFSLLISLGYIRRDTVEGMGQFSARGGIVDIFSPLSPLPVRMELFGDEIDSMGVFDPVSQRRTENIPRFKIAPAREVVLNAAASERCAAAVNSLLKRKNLGENVSDRLALELDAIKNGAGGESLDRFLYAAYGEGKCLFDYLDHDETALFVVNSADGEAAAAANEKILHETIKDMLEKGYIDGKNANFSAPAADLEIYRTLYPSIIADTFMRGDGTLYSGFFNMQTARSPVISAGLTEITDDLEKYVRSGYKTVLMLDSDSGIKSLSDSLTDLKITHAAPEMSRYSDISEIPPGVVLMFKTPKKEVAGLPFIRRVTGFENPRVKFVLIGDERERETPAGYGKPVGRAKKRQSGRQAIMSYADLAAGDYVVHDSYGIGVFAGIERLTVSGGVRKDFIKIEYQPPDILYVPCNQLDMVSKYIGPGSETGAVRVSKMGSAAWEKTKSRVKSAAKDIASGLIKLYAKRSLESGHAFPADTEWQRDFESLFEYPETDDQLACTAEIKEDMEKSIPMDRLLCGDVGFGKTEVALRAVFKCVSDSKQAAILVPTTILAWQHYRTVVSRFREFPVKTELLSRFKNPKEIEESLRKIKTGEADIVIGTHRLLQKDVKFAGLGLLVVDEEQRFGVTHKEKLKELARGIDVLTLTATPIPRTLNMAMSGIRDMSVIEEAPAHRTPVTTYIFEHDDNVVAEAIKNELRRGGQVFYLHNRVESIHMTAAKIAELSGGARVAVAHGQMDDRTLSSAWRAMVEGEVDVLVCTTIIESGIDVPNANTLIIEDADRLGLAQLHQIRGRVGRSSRRAFAYLTYPKNKVLSEIAAKRLKALREYTDFGAGFKIAMRDLEIRGAGNVLGAEQHGHMEAVGYDLYIKILERAVAAEKKRMESGIFDRPPDEDSPAPPKKQKYGTKFFAAETEREPEESQTPPEPSECLVDIAVDAFIPNGYIESDFLRIEIYKRIAAIESPADADDLADELTDRFGEPPAPAKNLLDIALIRNLGRDNFVEAIENKADGKITFKLPIINTAYGKTVMPKWLAAADVLGRDRVLFSMSGKPAVIQTLKEGERVIGAVKRTLELVDGGV